MSLLPTLLTSIALLTVAETDSAPIDVTRPDAIEFGASVDALTAMFESRCDTFDVRELDPASLPIAQSSHVQVDCHGFEHAGSARLAEFVFADDALAFVWILTEASEEADFLAAMQSVYGTPTHATAMFYAFADDHTALRRDIPEFLYYAESIAPMYRGWFDQMSAE